MRRWPASDYKPRVVSELKLVQPVAEKIPDGSTAAAVGKVIVDDEPSAERQQGNDSFETDGHRIVPVAIDVCEGDGRRRIQRVVVKAFDEIYVVRRRIDAAR